MAGATVRKLTLFWETLYLLCTAPSATEAQRLGGIGTSLNESTQFSPAPYDANSIFYLNTRNPATASGVVHSLKFCYSLSDSPGVSLHQATVGFFRRERNRYSLVKSFPMTKTADNQSDIFACEDMAIPSTEVEEGDMVGVCARSFSPAQRRINFIAITNSNRYTLQTETTQYHGVFCTSVGDVPLSFPRNSVSQRRRNILRIYGDIVDPTDIPIVTTPSASTIITSSSGTPNSTASDTGDDGLTSTTESGPHTSVLAPSVGGASAIILISMATTLLLCVLVVVVLRRRAKRNFAPSHNEPLSSRFPTVKYRRENSLQNLALAKFAATQSEHYHYITIPAIPSTANPSTKVTQRYEKPDNHLEDKANKSAAPHNFGYVNI